MHPQAFGIGHGVQREGVLAGTGDAEEVRTSSGCDHELRTHESRPVREQQAARGHVDLHDVRSDHLHVRVLAEDRAVGPCDVLGGQL